MDGWQLFSINTCFGEYLFWGTVTSLFVQWRERDLLIFKSVLLYLDTDWVWVRKLIKANFNVYIEHGYLSISGDTIVTYIEQGTNDDNT